jgi:hypothetical protein
MKARISLRGAAVLALVTAVVAAAQTPSTPKKPAAPPTTTQSNDREAQSGQASGRKSGSVIAVDREASSGMASGRRQHEPVLAATDKSLGSAHAIESVTTPEPPTDAKSDQTQKASSNPLYKDKGVAGTNPLYEAKDKQAAPKPSTSHETVEYKDPEDMTTRYRPGNNKTSKVKPTSSTGTTPPSQ